MVALFRRLLPLWALAVWPGYSATVLVMRFHNASDFSDLNWVGESVSEVLSSEFSANGLIVVDRDLRTEAMKRLQLRAEADFTKATIIRLGQEVDADYIIYGAYAAKADTDAQKDMRNSQLNITAHVMDLRHFHDGPDVGEAGKLADLTRLEEHLAWQDVKFLDPKLDVKLDQFMAPQKLVHVDAQESYVRGLLSTNLDQRQKWFTQAITIDPHFAGASYELGKLFLDKKDYRAAIQAFQRIPSSDARYPEARFRMGLCAYSAKEFAAAAGYFREVAATVPLDEVYNNLGAAESQLNQPAAIEDFRRAYDGDPNDPLYAFNLGLALLRQSDYTQAAKQFTNLAEHDENDDEVQSLLARAEEKTPLAAGEKLPAAPRLKQNFDANAFRELKAVLTPKGGV